MGVMDWDRIYGADSQVTLPDGRRLGYADYGDPGGFPVLYFHGFPGSRLEASLVADEALSRRVRLIAVERPGYGLSDPQPGRRLLDWPADVAALVDALGLERFSILGASGGGPYALACAFSPAARLKRVGLAAGLAPLREGQLKPASRLGMLLVRGAFPLLQALLASQARRHPGRVVALAARLLSAADREVLRRPEVNAVFQRSLQEAFRQGSAGMEGDMAIYGSLWGFRLQEVRFPVELWHGEADRLLPVRMGRQQAAALAHASARFLPGEGHFSLPVNRAGELFQRLRG